VTPLSTSTFWQVVFASMIIIPALVLWIAAVVDVFRHRYSGLKIAAVLVLILIVPVIGPLLYFVFRGPEHITADEVYMAQEDMRRERAQRPIGSTRF
jgi:hypothetical protein